MCRFEVAESSSFAEEFLYIHPLTVKVVWEWLKKRHWERFSERILPLCNVETLGFIVMDLLGSLWGCGSPTKPHQWK